MSISFHKDQVSLSFNNSLIKNWISKCVSSMDYKIKKIMFNFCDDEKLLKINIRHLGSDYLTDVIAFDYSSLPFVSGEIYVSIERVKSNAKKFNVSFDNELFRVIIHGVLHLCGFNDKTVKEKEEMRKQENFFLELNPCKSTA